MKLKKLEASDRLIEHHLYLVELRYQGIKLCKVFETEDGTYSLEKIDTREVFYREECVEIHEVLKEEVSEYVMTPAEAEAFSESAPRNRPKVPVKSLPSRDDDLSFDELVAKVAEELKHDSPTTLAVIASRVLGCSVVYRGSQSLTEWGRFSLIKVQSD